MWLEHLLWSPVILWVKVVCGMRCGSTFHHGIPANGIVMIPLSRSIARAAGARADRDRGRVLDPGPLFLFNNLHSLHHERR